MSSILYITFTDFLKMDSGSALRPQRMYSSFLKTGAEVILLSGSQARECRKARVQSIKETYKKITDNPPDICYIEPPTYPILYKEDYDLIKRVHKLGIPVGYFLRDAYQKLGKEFSAGEKITLRSVLRNIYLGALYRKNFKLIKSCVDIVYFPSLTMASYFSYKDMRALPPAGEAGLGVKSDPNSRMGIYVGGVSKAYGAELMLAAYDTLNSQGGQKYPLTIVCRKPEMANIPEKFLEKDWLSVVQASGEQLKRYYSAAGYALLPRMDSAYNDLSVSVKVYEYMSFGLPVVACNCKEMASIVNRYNFGIVTGFDAESFANGVKTLADDRELRAKCSENAINAVLNGNQWIDRAKTVENDLKELICK